MITERNTLVIQTKVLYRLAVDNHSSCLVSADSICEMCYMNRAIGRLLDT